MSEVPDGLTTRRRVIGGLGGAAAAALLSGCPTTRISNTPRWSRPLSRQPFVAPRVSMDRVVRVIVGHRPYRPAGFVVRREAFDSKHVVHNYGHGGGGITLSWGSSALAVREVADLPVARAAVIGAGIMGLTTARLLQDAGWQVTIYSRERSHHSTSNVGGGQWVPTSVFRESAATPAFKQQFNQAARIAHHAYQNMVGPRYGVRFAENYYLGADAERDPYHLRELPELFASVAMLGPGEHPFQVEKVKRVVTMMVEPAIFLPRVRDDFYLAGGKFVKRDFRNLDQVLGLSEATIFNCTGLGARALFGDEELVPAKGQLVFIPPDPAVDFLTIGGGSGVSYMFPRTGEIVLGGSWRRNDWSREPDPEITERIVRDHRTLFDAML